MRINGKLAIATQIGHSVWRGLRRGDAMSDFGEALGTAAEGGLLSKAVSRSGRRASEEPALSKGHFAEGDCLNCGTRLVGAHCHECGQQAHLHRTMGAFLHDLLHGALHFEGKTWKTLPMLVFKPGELTRRYIEGERARFVSPMALFLFSIFLMFAVFQAVGLTTPSDISTPDKVAINIDEARDRAKDDLAETEARLKAMSPDDPGRGKLENDVADARKALEAFSKIDAVRVGNGSKNLDVNVTGIEAIDKGLVEKWVKHPELMLYKLQSNSYKFSWLLIPLSIPFMWLLFFWKRRFRAYDHAIFVTYSIAFMSMLFIAASVMMTLGVAMPVWVTLLGIVPPIHVYKQLRGAYGLSRFSAFWRLCVLSIFIMIVLTLFLQLLLLLGTF